MAWEWLQELGLKRPRGRDMQYDDTKVATVSMADLESGTLGHRHVSIAARKRITGSTIWRP